MTLHRLTFQASYSCALCEGARLGHALRLCRVVADLEDDRVVEASYYLCDACIADNGPALGGWLLRRTLFRWRDTMRPSSLTDREGDKKR